MRRLDRYVIQELTSHFAFGVAIFLCLLVSGTLLAKVIRLGLEQGLPLSAVLLYFIYKLPEFVVYTLPMSMLLATLLSFGRFSSDGEYVAVLAGGVPGLRMFAPALGLGVVVSVVSLLANELVVAQTNERAESVLSSGAKQAGRQPAENVLIRSPEVGPRERVIYARKLHVASGMIEGLDLDVYRDDRRVLSIRAQRAVWDQQAGRWLLRGVTGESIRPGGAVVRIETAETSEEQYQPGKSPAELAQRRKLDPSDMSVAELRARLRELRVMARDAREITASLFFMHRRIATAFCAIVFALIGAPLGLRPHRTSSSIGLGISVVIIFAYYVLLYLTEIVGQRGALPPLVAAWAPNIIVGGAGVLLVGGSLR